MTIRSLIKTDFEQGDTSATIETVEKKIVGQGVVVLMKEGTYFGLVTCIDLLGRQLSSITQYIDSRPIVSPDLSTNAVIKLMRQSKTRILPVFDNGAFVGLIYYDDIIEQLAAIVEEQKSIVQTIAHDLKNQIASIKGLSSILRNNLVKEENIQNRHVTMRQKL